MIDFLANTPRTPRDAYVAAVKVIGPKKVAQKTGLSLTHVYKMKADPETNGETRTDLFEQSILLAKDLAGTGHIDDVYIVADAFVRILRGRIEFDEISPDKDTFQEEIIDSMTTVSRLMRTCHGFIEGKASKSQMRLWLSKAKKELDELVEKANQEKINGCTYAKETAPSKTTPATSPMKREDGRKKTAGRKQLTENG